MSSILRVRTTLVGLAAFVLVCAAVSSAYSGLPMSRFTQDPAAIADMNPLNGVISNLGILYWAAAASVSLFTALMLLAVSSRQGWGQFFLFFGLFTTLLLLDDLFMLHERIFPLVFGIGEKIVLGIYAVILMGGLWTYLPQIRASNYALLLAASFFFWLLRWRRHSVHRGVPLAPPLRGRSEVSWCCCVGRVFRRDGLRPTPTRTQ